MPPRTFSSDVFPATLRPTRPTGSPARMVNPAPSTTRVPPISTARFRTANTADECDRGGQQDQPRIAGRGEPFAQHDQAEDGRRGRLRQGEGGGTADPHDVE